jgi:predicted phage replisome organizer/uncharacterized phage protein (TIGR02220 family)
MASEVKWIKITTDIFDDEKILLIESMPDAYAIITCWFKLLCLAGKQNNSGVFMMGQIAYTDKMLATIFRMKETTVQFALQAFEQFGMIEIVDGVITIPNWEKHQSLDKMEQAKEQTRLRVEKHRKKQRLLAGSSTDVTQCNVTCNADVTQCNADRIEEEGEKDNISIMSGKPDHLSEKAAKIIARLNEKTGANYQSGTASTVRKIQARLNEGFSVEDFFTVIDAKAAEWMGSPMEQYLRPDTLFCTKFEGYLQAAKRSTSGGGVWAREEQDDLDFVK